MISDSMDPSLLLFGEAGYGLLFLSFFILFTWLGSSSSKVAAYMINELFVLPILISSGSNALISLGYALLSGGVCLRLAYTVRSYNPISRVMFELNAFALIWVYLQVELPQQAVFVVLGVLGNVIQCFGGFLFHEVVILHLMGLEKNTKKEISLRRTSKRRFY